MVPIWDAERYQLAGRFRALTGVEIDRPGAAMSRPVAAIAWYCFLYH
jgi:hypothetical protein